ncbi:MAG TPA: 4-hydroxy-tetrahydrodipicolinate synthase [Actinomycetota bacterium]|nr:4-hydroxy-tetrahydrodipicolinate synthase [Actinomycetota bacterium]
MAARFGRVITAMVTPFREDGSLDFDEAQKLARHLIEHGSEGLVVAGSTGEASTLTDEEQATLFRVVKDAVGTDAHVVAGTGTNWTEHSVELTRAAEKAGADAALVVTPYYNRPPQDALLNHFRLVADSSNLPVLIYDVPSRTVTKIEVETVLAAAEHPNIVGIKDAGGDIATSTLLAAQKPDDFEIYSGDDSMTLAFLAIGGVGVISVLAHVMGEHLLELVKAFESGDSNRARELQYTQQRVNKTLMNANPVAIKAAVNMLGFKVGEPRPPLRGASAEEQQSIRAALQEIGAL